MQPIRGPPIDIGSTVMSMARPGTERRAPVLALFGLFGVGNLGNEASLSAAIGAVRSRRPHARLVCVCANPERVVADHGIEAVSIRMGAAWSKYESRPRVVRLLLRPFVEITSAIGAYRFLRSVDAVVVPGTGILDDFGMRPHQIPLDLVKWTGLARLARRRWAYLSIGAGPVESRASRLLFRLSVTARGYCSARDESSQEFLAKLNPRHARRPLYPDLAYTLPTPSTESGPSTPTTAIGVMSYYGWRSDPERGAQKHERYVNEVSALIRRQLRAGISVVLLVGDEVDRETADRIASAAHIEDAPPGSAIQVPFLRSMSDVLETISRCDIVTASRFHNVVAALMMHRPVVAIGYATKFDELMTHVGMGEFTQHIERLDADRLDEALTQIRRDSARHAARIATVVASDRSRLEHQYDLVLSTLGPGDGASTAPGVDG